MPVSVDEMLEYLGIDESDGMIVANVTAAIAAAHAYLKSAVGEDYPTRDPKAVQLAKIIAADFYGNREMLELSARQAQYSNVRKLVSDMALQLRMELRRDGML